MKKKNAFCFREFKCYEQNKAELTARDTRGAGLLLYRGSWGEGREVRRRALVRASQAAGRQSGVPSWEWVWRDEGMSSMGRWAAKWWQQKEEHSQPDPMRAPNGTSECLKLCTNLCSWPDQHSHLMTLSASLARPGVQSLTEHADGWRLIRGEVGAAPQTPGQWPDSSGPKQSWPGPTSQRGKIAQVFLATLLTWSFWTAWKALPKCRAPGKAPQLAGVPGILGDLGDPGL